MTKRILIFSLSYYPRNVSGAEGAVKEITDRITDVEFSMVTLRFDNKDVPIEKIGNVEIHRVGNGSYLGKILFPILAAFKARELHAAKSFDALWAMMTYMLLPTMIAKILGVHIPHVLTLQDGDSYQKVFSRLRIIPFLPIIDAGFKKAKVIQVISTYLSTWPKKRGSSAPIELIYNGANPRDLKESVPIEEVDNLKKKIGKGPEDIYLTNTARLEYQKAQDDVIRALPKLPQNVKFLVVGGGSDEQMLKTLTKELNLENRVIFTGQVTRDEVTKFRKASDIFVAPSRSEGLGNAFLSAMASRLPVVATQEGGLADFIFDAKRNPGKETTAWAVDKDSPDQIAEAVKDILSNPEKVKKVTDTARKMVEEKYDWDNIAKAMRANVFERILR